MPTNYLSCAETAKLIRQRHGSGGDLCAKAVAQNRERMRA